MALDLGTMYAKVELDRRDYQQGMKEIPQQAETAFKRVASLAGTYLTARAIFGFVREGVNEFSILQEACNKFDAVFGNIHDFRSSKHLAAYIGIVPRVSNSKFKLVKN